jgi:hypothetical protein
MNPVDMNDDQLKDEFYSALKTGKDTGCCDDYLSLLTELMVQRKLLGRA